MTTAKKVRHGGRLSLVFRDPAVTKAREAAAKRVDMWSIPVQFNQPCPLAELRNDPKLDLLAYHLIRDEGIDPNEEVLGGYGRQGLRCILTQKFEYRERNKKIDKR